MSKTAQRKFHDKVIPWIASSKSSDQKVKINVASWFILSTHFKIDGKKIGNKTFDNHWHMDYWLDTTCCSNNNATLWIWALHQQNLSNVSYGIVQNLFCAELWDLWNEVKLSFDFFSNFMTSNKNNTRFLPETLL